MNCNLCPRNCGVQKPVQKGFCGTGGIVLSRVAAHNWEEPCISGTRGSGTVFFAGCNLKCRFCQNFDISVVSHGEEVSAERLADVFLYVQETGVANINLVTPSHVADGVAKALTLAKPFLKIPVVYNTSSYEKISSLKMLEGLVDVYMPDLKFCNSDVSRLLCGAGDYFRVATSAITEMRRQCPDDIFDGEGYMQKGLLLRHLVLPSFTEDSKKVLDWVADFDKNTYVSLMAQYFPARKDDNVPQLNRRLYRHEYDNVLQYFFNVGLKNGFMQDAQSATADYLPAFSDSDVKDVLSVVPHVFEAGGV